MRDVNYASMLEYLDDAVSDRTWRCGQTSAPLNREFVIDLTSTGFELLDDSTHQAFNGRTPGSEMSTLPISPMTPASDSIDSEMTPPSLLDLPTELRIEICRYIFDSKAHIHNPWFGLLLTSRKLHAEVTDLLKEATLRVRLQPTLFHRVLAHNLTLQQLSHLPADLEPHARIVHFQSYAMRFGEVVFDITNTQDPTDCRLQPSYARKGHELADALTRDLEHVLTTPSGKGTDVDIVWGSFSRNVYMGVTTWDCCVLNGMGSMLSSSLARGDDLSQRLYSTIVLEEVQRKGMLDPDLFGGGGASAVAPGRPRGFGRGLAAKVKLAMHGRA